MIFQDERDASKDFGCVEINCQGERERESAVEALGRSLLSLSLFERSGGSKLMSSGLETVSGQRSQGSLALGEPEKSAEEQ